MAKTKKQESALKLIEVKAPAKGERGLLTLVLDCGKPYLVLDNGELNLAYFVAFLTPKVKVWKGSSWYTIPKPDHHDNVHLFWPTAKARIFQVPGIRYKKPRKLYQFGSWHCLLTNAEAKKHSCIDEHIPVF